MRQERVGWLATLILAACAACRSEPDPAPAHEPALASASPAPIAEAPSAHATDAREPADESEEGEPLEDGKFLYTRNCAGCHNDNGDGRGPTALQLNVIARSFAEGNFAFGNTRESILRTISSGVPGRSVMPAYAGILTKEQCELVVDHVLTLMPAQPKVDPKAGLMHVVDRPVVVRGSLPPIVEGAPPRPRGLLIGLPEGLTFEYRTDDVRLLGVRLGDFVDRRDWGDRGGSTLEPLGRVVYALQRGDPPPLFGPCKIGGGELARCQLKSTTARAGEHGAGLSYALVCDGMESLMVHETLSASPSSVGVAFSRTLKLRNAVSSTVRTLEVAGRGTGSRWVHGVPEAWIARADVDEADAASNGASASTKAARTAPVPADGWIAMETEGEGCELVHIRAPRGTELVEADGAVRLSVQVPEKRAIAISIRVVLADAFTPEALAAAMKEVE